MRLCSWNVNGIRAASQNSDFKKILSEESPFDVVCFQEIKAFDHQLEFWLRQPPGYFANFSSADKPGYSGVAVYSRKEPLEVLEGMAPVLGASGKEFDQEGRWLQLDFGDWILLNGYFPNSQRDHARLDYKLRFCDSVAKICEHWRSKGKSVVVCGDFNISHRPLDLKNPKQNEKNAGYLPEERAWMDRFIDSMGYIDTFRAFEPGPGHYSWWSYRPGIRERNIGWRLDYFVTSPESRDRLVSAAIHSDIKGSDHCPVTLEWRD